MKAALFSSVPYVGPAAPPGWPVPGSTYSTEAAQQSMQTQLDRFRLADELGFDWVTVAEHHFAPFSLTPNPMVMAGALTQVVKRAKIAVLGPTLPILNPIRVAEELAMLDTLSGGRVIAGMMRGTPNEYVTYNVNPAESRDRFQEALLLIKKAWTETQPFGWVGKHYEFRAVSIWPRPVQAPHPPIYMSGSSPESGEFAARNRIGLGLAVTTVPLASKAVRYYREQAELTGWTPDEDQILYRVAAHVADTDEEAFADLGASAPQMRYTISNQALESAVATTGYYGRDIEAQRGRVTRLNDVSERIQLGQLLLGGPETVFKQVKAIRDELGAGILDIVMLPQPEQKAIRAIELLGTKILPRMREI